MSDLTDIHSTVLNNLPPDVAQAYPQYISPVVSALISREEEIVTRLRTIAASFGLGDGDTERVLVEAGLVRAESTPATLEERESLASIQKTLTELIEQVRKMGGSV